MIDVYNMRQRNLLLDDIFNVVTQHVDNGGSQSDVLRE